MSVGVLQAACNFPGLRESISPADSVQSCLVDIQAASLLHDEGALFVSSVKDNLNHIILALTLETHDDQQPESKEVQTEHKTKRRNLMVSIKRSKKKKRQFDRVATIDLAAAQVAANNQNWKNFRKLTSLLRCDLEDFDTDRKMYLHLQNDHIEVVTSATIGSFLFPRAVARFWEWTNVFCSLGTRGRMLHAGCRIFP